MINVSENIFDTVYAPSLMDRFLRYVRTYSESDSSKADAGIMPSTLQQKDMAALLNQEMKDLGLDDVQTTDSAILTVASKHRRERKTYLRSVSLPTSIPLKK